MGKLFGTDGIRGRANIFPMSPDLVLTLGQAIGHYFRKTHINPHILIGKDTRRSGYMLEQALCSGLCSVGADAFFLGPLPTPGIAYLTRGMRATAGIVISASHNPYHDNGIKIFSSDGYKLPDEVEDQLEKLIYDKEMKDNLPVGTKIGTARRIDDAIGQYAVFLKEQFPKHLTLEGLRLVVDCANGASYKVAPKVFQELGAEVFLIGVEPDGTNINEQCGALYPQQLMERVRLYKADIGIAVDGDADRLIVVDDKGQLMDGDEVMAICANHLIKQGRLKQNTVVSTIMSNMGLDIALKKAGGKVIRTKVGDRYVVEEMIKGNFNFGGEQSGHLIFRDCSTTGDGVLAALHLLEIVVSQEQKLSELRKCMEPLPQVMKNVEVDSKIPIEQLPDLSKLLSSAENSLGREGRVVFRYSGTENLARIMIEGSNLEKIEKMADDLAQETLKSIKEHCKKNSSSAKTGHQK